jgi:hypothetical protein
MSDSIHEEYVATSYVHGDKRLSVYIAGPMSGMPKLNHDSFNNAENRLEKSRIFNKIVNPASLDITFTEDLEGIAATDNEYRRNAISRDIDLLLNCDSIFMLEGWENSKGAQVEHALANYLGLKIFYESRAGTV